MDEDFDWIDPYDGDDLAFRSDQDAWEDARADMEDLFGYDE